MARNVKEGKVKRFAAVVSKEIEGVKVVGIEKQKKVLTKPKGSSVIGVSSRKTLSRFAQTTGPLVREVEKKVIVVDNRSQFFKREMEKESKWLG